MAGRDVIDRYHRAIAVGDYDTVIALHAPDVVVWMSGQSIVSGRFQGRETVFAHMTHHVLGPLDAAVEEYVKGVRVVAEDGDRVAVIFHGGLPNRTGGRYNQYYLQVFRIGDGLIQEIVEIFDTVMFEQAVVGNRLETTRAFPARPFALSTPLAGAGVTDRAIMVDLAERWRAAAQAGDWPQIAALAAPGCTLEVAGTTPLSGIGSFNLGQLRLILASDIDWSCVACADTTAAVLLMHSADLSGDQNYGIVLEPRGDCIGRVTIFWDTTMAEAGLYTNPMLPAPTRRVMPPFDIRQAFVASEARDAKRPQALEK